MSSVPSWFAVPVAALAILLGTAPAVAAADPVGGPALATQHVVVGRGAPALPQGLAASSWIVADATSGAVLAARAPHLRYPPASTLKVLTAITLIPRITPLSVVVPTFDDVNVDGSKVGLVPGAKYRAGLVFTAMLLASGNDAADALATASGGTAKALAAMNATARELQADDTYAGTPSGLDAPGETSSAYDLALFFRAGLALPAFRHYIGTVMAYVPDPKHHHPFQIYTHDYLLTTYPGMIGGKNGYTVAADGTFVGAARRGGRTIIVALMHANPDFWPTARALLDWGFAADGRAAPVGVLVPSLAQVAAARAAAQVRPAAATRAVSDHPRAGGGLAWPLGVAGLSAALATGVARRSRRRRPRLRLPPI